MGIKDNFSQAVKELWKKDGQDKGDSKSDGSTELDKYLRQDGEPQNTGANGVPLETPYYRNPAPVEKSDASVRNSQTEQENPASEQDRGFTQESPAAPERNTPPPTG